jgi:nickel-dependent lactate racemase
VPEEEALDAAGILASAVADPFGTPPLVDMLERGRKVVIVVDDMTRPTPTVQLLDAILPELDRAGVRREDITILLALGTHRDMTPEEIRAGLGDEISRHYRVVNHHARAAAELTHCGATLRGTEAVVNRLAAEADFLIGCGHIVPHRIAGFSGGGKIVLPGIASNKSVGQMHWLSTQFPNEKITGVRDNPVRTEIDGVAKLAGLRFILNVVQDGAGRVVQAVAGDLVAAHREGIYQSLRIYGAAMPERADIVVADSYPSDIDMWQAAKAIFACGLAVKKGGTIVLVTPCPEGVALPHPQVLEFGYARRPEVTEIALDGRFPDMVAASHIIEFGEVLDRARIILVSEGIDAQAAQQLGLDWAESPQTALDMALADAGASASIAVLKQASELAPYQRD